MEVLNVHRHPSSITVKCFPNPVQSGQWTLCTAIVNDTSTTPTVPMGVVVLIYSQYPQIGCNLNWASNVSASCSFNERVDVSALVIVRYEGDYFHAPSRGSSEIDVNG